MATEGVLINGVTYDFSCVRLTVFGLKIVEFNSIDYNHKLERGEARGASQVSLGVSKGKYTTDPVKISIEKQMSKILRDRIASQSRSGKSLGRVKGTIHLQFVDDEIGTQTVLMKKCQVNVDGDGSLKEGNDPLYESWEFYTRAITKNGISLFESDDPGAQ